MKIALAIPTLGNIDANLVLNLLKWYGQGKIDRFIFVNEKPVESARNSVVRQFLTTECTHLWFIDDDTVPPEDALDKLLALDADVATGVTPVLKVDKSFPNVYVEHKEGAWKVIGKEISEVLRCGASCLLIKREVLEKVGNPYFELVWDSNYLNYVSEDMSFCDKVREKGFKIMCDPSVKCNHRKEIYL